jgi:hypothetical protein
MVAGGSHRQLEVLPITSSKAILSFIASAVSRPCV